MQDRDTWVGEVAGAVTAFGLVVVIALGSSQDRPSTVDLDASTLFAVAEVSTAWSE